ncbi:MAG TPA: 5'-nucleotidase C-terminal domain-containing protein [Beutenbergiaceae bacterium]|nr:5'-nucleotidase C-terminal domain-containing protein [Beutenbergiaceae bacterium]
MTTKLSSGRARFRRSTAALGIAGLTLAGLAGPALADGEDPEQPANSEPSGDVQPPDEDRAGEGQAERPTEEQPEADEDLDEADPSENGESAEADSLDEDSESKGSSDDDAEEEAHISPLSLNEDGTELTVDLVGINDFHGRVDEGRGDITDDDGDVIGFDDGAAVRLAAAVEDVRAANEDTLFVGAGDLFGASTFTSMAGNDNPTIDVLNAMGMDVSSVGNHEFDEGIDVLNARIAGVSIGEIDYSQVGWPYLGANVLDSETEESALEEYEVLTTDNGAEIAFVGVVTQETPFLVTPKGIEGLEFTDPAEAVERVIDEEDDVQNADAIVVLTHDGGSNKDAVESTATDFGQFAQEMADRGDVAAIFSGHTHTLYEADVDGMPVIQTGSYGENLGKITLTFEDEDGDWEFAGAASDMISLAGYDVPDDNEIVTSVRGIVEDAVAEAEEIGETVIGEAGADLLRATHTDPETGTEGENRGGESTISNLIADAQLWGVADQGSVPEEELPKIAFMNPGGVRTDITEGDVNYKQAASVQPFANTLETFDLTGAQIKQVLEEQWQPDGVSRPFLKLGVNEEFFYTYDPEAPRDERVTQMFLDGEPIVLDETYRVVANNFLASGGDNFFTLGEGSDYADTGLVDLQAFVKYFESNDVVNPDYRQRAVGVHWATGEEGVYDAGDPVEIALSSLVFANDEPKSETVFASLTNSESGETIELGEFDVDPEIVNTTDEMGRALVEFAMPEIEPSGDDSDSWVLEITDDLELLSLTWGITVEQDSEEPPPPTDEGEDEDTDDEGGAGPDGDMPETGTDVNGMLIASAILLAIGGTALAVRRRQTTG